MEAAGSARGPASPSSIRWTFAGAVATPDTLQVRVAPAFLDRVQVGAPIPGRPLSVAEVDANVHHFTEGLRGPRTQPVRRLVLSGLDTYDGAGALAGAVERWRQLGVESLVAHVGAVGAQTFGGSPLGRATDRVVVSVGRVDDEVLGALGSLPLGSLEVAVSLTADVRSGMGALVEVLRRQPPRALAWVWPFPGVGVDPPPQASEVVGDLERAGALELPGARLVHVPPCQDPRGELETRWRTRNRYYVDAEHQREDALLFFPELVRLAKPDSCRFCRADLHCDGVASAWLEQGRTGPLEPM